jgi:hypothetical protein
MVEVHWALREAQTNRGISCQEIDAAALFASGHASKLLAPIPIKRLGVETLFPLVWALGKRLVIEDDPDASPTNTPRRVECRVVAYVGSKKQQVRATLQKAARRFVRIERKAWSRSANEARNSKLTPERRSEIARTAARARHQLREHHALPALGPPPKRPV